MSGGPSGDPPEGSEAAREPGLTRGRAWLAGLTVLAVAAGVTAALWARSPDSPSSPGPVAGGSRSSGPAGASGPVADGSRASGPAGASGPSSEVAVSAPATADLERSAAVSPAPIPTFMPVAEAVAAATTSAGKRSARVQFSLPRAAGSWPGANGHSGVNGYPVLDSASVQRFCADRGRACNVAQTYTDRTDYESMTRGSGWTFEFFGDFDGVLVVSQGLVPDGREDLLDDCAAGDYDGHWRDFGSLMVADERGDSVVRLGWEMNESSMGWRGLDTEDYLACYRRAADALRATNPAVVLDWTINAHNTPKDLCGGLSVNCYPGDEYVDIVGIDNYDHHPWSPTEADFDRTGARKEGLDWLFSFARAHGKLFSVGEWGIMPTADAGKDNPAFIGWMHDWFAGHAPYLAYEAYFQRCDGKVSQSSILRPGDPDCLPNPGSSQAYRSRYAT